MIDRDDLAARLLPALLRPDMLAVCKTESDVDCLTMGVCVLAYRLADAMQIARDPQKLVDWSEVPKKRKDVE